MEKNLDYRFFDNEHPNQYQWILGVEHQWHYLQKWKKRILNSHTTLEVNPFGRHLFFHCFGQLHLIYLESNRSSVLSKHAFQTLRVLTPMVFQGNSLQWLPKKCRDSVQGHTRRAIQCFGNRVKKSFPRMNCLGFGSSFSRFQSLQRSGTTDKSERQRNTLFFFLPKAL